MTALIYLLDPSEILIGMDSLSLCGEDKEPHKYCSKIFALPHLGGAICGTGSLKLVLDWYVYVQTMVLARDMDYLDEIAPDRLRELSAGLDEPASSTIFHFGYSPSASAFTGTAFRSGSNFDGEQLEYGLGIKPGFDEIRPVAAKLLDELGPFGAVLDIMDRLRVVDDELEPADRVGIGGQAHLLVMGGSRQLLYVADQWPDFEVQFDAMLRRLEKKNAGWDDSADADA